MSSSFQASVSVQDLLISVVVPSVVATIERARLVHVVVTSRLGAQSHSSEELG